LTPALVGTGCASESEVNRSSGDGVRCPLRLAGAVLVEQHDEWEAGDRRYISESSMLERKTVNDPTVVVEEVGVVR